jgi:hypothetical protein
MLSDCRMPRFVARNVFSQVVDDRKVQQRLAAEERHHELRRMRSSSPAIHSARRADVSSVILSANWLKSSRSP